MTINTDADVIRVIQENPRLLIEAITAHPELRAEVRRAVLTDELLAMPEQLAEVIKTQNEMLKAQDEMLTSLAETRATQNEMLKVQAEILTSLAETRESLAETRATQNEMLKVQAEILKSLAETRATQNEMLKTQAEILTSLAETRESLAETRATQNEMLKVQAEILTSLAETRESLAETRATQNEMLKVQAEILKSLAETRETQNEMLKAQREMLEEQANVRQDIGALHGMYRRQHEDFGRFRGNYAIDATRRNEADIALLLSKSSAHGFRRVSMRDFSQTDINNFLAENYDAIDALGLRERAWNTFLKGDIIARVTELMGDTPGFYLAVEASYTSDIEDLRRAVDHAKMLRCAGDLAAYAVVAGVRKNSSVEGPLVRRRRRVHQRAGRRLGSMVSARSERCSARRSILGAVDRDPTPSVPASAFDSALLDPRSSRSYNGAN